ALDMRRMIETEKPARSIWDLKLIPGGIIDIEFITQVFVLCGQVRKDDTGGGQRTGTSDILGAIRPEAIAPQIRHDLIAACQIYMASTQISRLCLMGPSEPDNLPPGLVDIFLRAVDLPELSLLETHLSETAQTVRAH